MGMIEEVASLLAEDLDKKQGDQVLQTTLGSLKFTESHIVTGAERSERGLFDMFDVLDLK